MPISEPHFTHLTPASRADVFERLNKAIDDLKPYIPYWKAFVLKRLGWEEWPGEADEREPDDCSFPKIEDCFDSVLQELGTDARLALLDPHLQIEVVVGNGYVPSPVPDAPTWAFPVHRQEWINDFVYVRSDTNVLLLLFHPDIELLPKEEVMEDLRHELGHTFIYLRDLQAEEDCDAAEEEWKRCTQLQDFIIRIPLGQLHG